MSIEWTCHVCGDRRPDELIAVRKIARSDHGVEWQENVRYCADRPECAAQAGLGHRELARRRPPPPTVERRGLFRWYAVFPAAPGDGMGTEAGPCLTRAGAARLAGRPR